ncbi:acyltransferase [Sphingobium sp. BS19]|uniref:acyltransferase family protein n=1 Tax=Sphingobium sp. BS19 TaxID=3018973 RepID=UPI002490F669|nr:acyltransferase [Sphingobium sp. BS19]|tara:strand:- start:2747 stop:3790 length:1044 start_codon:yes stop_codon:yes gene_type:complete
MSHLPYAQRAIERIRYLDGWRGFAILAVMFAHFITSKHLNFGRLGVELFFVLSGRLMAEILFVRNTPLSAFFPRRISRVYPALFVFLSLMLMAGLVLGIGDMNISGYVTSVSFAFNYSQIWMGRPAVLGHVWSLCVEEHMYIVLGVVAFIHRKRPLPIIKLLIFFSVVSIAIGAIQTAMGMSYYEVYWRTDVRGGSILIGAIAYLSTRNFDFNIIPPWLPLASGVLAVLLSMDVVPDPVKYSLGTALLAISLISMPRAPKFALVVLEHPLVLRIGIWSYSMYLWQQPFGKLANSTTERVMSLPLVFLATILSYYFVERPARAIINAWVERRRASLYDQTGSIGRALL